MMNPLKRPLTPVGAFFILSVAMPFVIGWVALDTIVRHRQWQRDPSAEKRYKGQYPYHNGPFA
jgi:hypothetical protein